MGATRRQPKLGWEAPGDLRVQPGEGKDINGVYFHKIHSLKVSFSPEELMSVI